MTKGVYVLETCWSWDNTNTEYRTITVEEPDEGFEEVFFDASVSPMTRRVCLQKIIELAMAAQDRSILGKNKLVRLYRIEQRDKEYKKPKVTVNKRTGHVTVTMRMIPVCDFDEGGNPIPIRNN